MRTTPKRPFSPVRTAVAVLTATFTLLVGCTSQDDPATRSGTGSQTEASARGSSTPPEAATQPIKSATQVAIDKITGGKVVELSMNDLPRPPAGFTKSEVRAFARRAIEIIRRGISHDLAGLTPDEAFLYTFANQYPATTDYARSTTESAVSDRYDWQWAWASLFDAPPTEPVKFITARWQIETAPGTLDNGTLADQLVVSLKVAIEHQIPTSGGPNQPRTEPVVVQRTVTVRGYEPLGGAEWWPAVTIQAGTLFDTGCALVNGSRLIPAPDNSKRVRTGLRTLRQFIKPTSRVEIDARSEGDDFDSFVKTNCVALGAAQ